MNLNSLKEHECRGLGDAGVELPQRGVQQVGLPPSGPDHGWCGTGQHLDLRSQRGSGASGAWWARSRRTISANACASPGSDLAPDAGCRSRQRANIGVGAPMPVANCPRASTRSLRATSGIRCHWPRPGPYAGDHCPGWLQSPWSLNRTVPSSSRRAVILTAATGPLSPRTWMWNTPRSLTAPVLALVPPPKLAAPIAR